MLSTWVGTNVPTPLIPLAFSIIAAIMSFFSSTTGVVAPALFPLIPGLAESTGLSAGARCSPALCWAHNPVPSARSLPAAL